MNVQTQVLNMQLRQLKRLLETKRLTFRDSYYVIFSDYPSQHDIKVMLETVDLEIDSDLMTRIYKEFNKL